MLGKAASEANQILNKVDDFKYFMLLGTFVMMLDSALIHSSNVSLLEIKWSDVDSTITIGDALVFICFFSLYITFIVTGIRIFISGLALALPEKISAFLNSDSYNPPARNEYVYTWDLESTAIRKNNAIAYEAAKSKRREMDSQTQLERYCLAFLVSSIVNYFTSSTEIKSLFVTLSYISDFNNPTAIETIKMVLGSILYFGMFKIGVLDGCGFIYGDSNRDRIYLKKDSGLS